jgi:diguanylate cyclase (GGDEF)-like protein
LSQYEKPQSSSGRQDETLRIFHETARALTSSLDLDTVLRAIMQQMEDFFEPEHWSLLIVDDETSKLYYALSAGVDESVTRDIRLSLGEGIAGHVALSGQSLVIPDISADPEWSVYAREHPELKLRSLACLPIRHGNRPLGVLQVNNSGLDLLPESSIAFLRVLCNYAAIALQNARHVKLIQRLTITDDCTGLYNARYLYTALNDELLKQIPILNATRRPEDDPHFSLLFFDIDHFKTVNDTHGHLAGSWLLSELGKIIKRAVGPENAAFRYGGDEFVVLLRDMNKPAAALLAARLREDLNNTHFLTDTGIELQLTASFGLATFPQDGTTLQDLIRAADTMMYVAKDAGRDRIVLADAKTLAEHAPNKASRHN